VIALLVDQNFNEHIVDGLTRRDVTLDCVHVRDLGLAAASDPTILEWAATQGRVLLTHDRKTIPPFAYARVTAGLPMSGVFLVSDDLPVGQAIDELLIAIHCLSPDECRDIVRYFPM
jgi:predicted nuclease of predicted toxin-antitoxin system